MSTGLNKIRANFLSHRVSRNVIALGLIQLSNYAIPLLLLPYLTRVLGLELFGVMAFGLSISQLAFVVTDYGFSLSATENISINREDKQYIEETLSAIFIIKTGLFFIVVLVVTIFAFYNTKYEDYKWFLMLSLIAILGQTFQPVWFFQGIERMKFLTLYTVTARIIYFMSVILFVKNSQDYMWVPVMNGIAQMTAAVLAIFLIYKLEYQFRRPPSIEFVKRTLQKSTHYFLSRISVAMYTSGSAFFLGIFGTLDQVAIYSLAEQIYKGLQGFYMPINAALYPYMAKEKDFKLFFGILAFLLIAGIIGTIIGFQISNYIIIFLFGIKFLGTTVVVKYFLIILLINILGVFFGYGFLSSFGKTSIANNSVIAGSILHILILFFSGLLMGLDAERIAVVILITEFFVCVIRMKFSYNEYRKYLLKVMYDTDSSSACS